MTEKTVTQDTQARRDELVREISYELDKIARTLPEIVPLDADQVHFLVRAMAGRMLRLTSVLMEIGQDERDIGELESVVTLQGFSQG